MRTKPISTSWLTSKQRDDCIQKLIEPSKGTWLWSKALDGWNWSAINDPTNEAEKEWARVLSHFSDLDERLNVIYLLSDDPNALTFIHRLMQRQSKQKDSSRRFRLEPFISMLGNLARQYPDTFRFWYNNLEPEYRGFTTRIVGHVGNPSGHKKRPDSVLYDILWLQQTLRGSTSAKAASLYIHESYTTPQQMDVLVTWLNEQTSLQPSDYAYLWDSWISGKHATLYTWIEGLPQHPEWTNVKKAWMDAQPIPNMDSIRSVVANPLDLDCSNDDLKTSLFYHHRDRVDEKLQYLAPLSVSTIDSNIFQWLPKTTSTWMHQCKTIGALSGTSSYKLTNRIALCNAYAMQQKRGTALPLKHSPTIFKMTEWCEMQNKAIVNPRQMWDYIIPEEKTAMLKILVSEQLGKQYVNENDNHVLDQKNMIVSYALNTFDDKNDAVYALLHARTNRNMQVGLLCLRSLNPDANWDDWDHLVEKARLYTHMDVQINWMAVLESYTSVCAIEFSDIEDATLS